MTIKLLLLISALTLASVTGKAQDYRPAEKDLAWGDDSKGLRMAVWTNPETDQVFSVIRNFSTRQVSYYDIVVYHEVYARQSAASKWRRIKLKPAEPKEVIALLSCHTIRPKEEEVRGYLDLREYDFPAGWNGVVEVRIVRILSSADGECDKNYRTAKVKSRTINVKLPLTAAAQR
jgi:hypothetical protein